MSFYRFLLVIMFCAFGAARADHVLSSYRFDPVADTQIKDVAKKYETRRGDDGGFEVIVPASEFREFLKLAPQAELIDWDIRNELTRMDETEPGWRAQYHTFSQVATILKDYEKHFPQLAKLETYGQSKGGKPLYALRVTAAQEGAPEILLTAATHGDELITVEVLLAILDRLMNGFNDPRINRILSSHVIYVVPVVNPDGFIAQERYDHGVDPNRSYPWPGDPSAEPSPAIGPIIQFFAKHNFVGSIDFHAKGRLLMYPWAYTDEEAESHDLKGFEEISRAMAKINHYTPGQISHILYTAEGSSADYYYWKHKTLAFGIEMATNKVPSPTQIPAVIKENLESTLLFLEFF